jgi:hypothetical protein
MNKTQQAINFRVNKSEREHFEKAAAELDESIAGLFRYLLSDHFLSIERNQLIDELKHNTKADTPEIRDNQRAEILKKLYLNLRTSLRWYKNKTKAYNRQIARLEKLQQGFQQFEDQVKNVLDEELI